MLTVIIVLVSVLALAELVAGVRLFVYLVGGQADVDGRLDAYCK
jgi:hypothetical protein